MYYIGRAGHSGDIIPGKLVPAPYNRLYVGYGMREHQYTNYEALVLINPKEVQLKWVAASGGHIPAGAIPGGWNRAGCEVLYIGRTLPGT